MLDWEIEGILQLGVTVKKGLRWGRDFTVESLRGEGYEAFVLAIGANSLIGKLGGLDSIKRK